MNPLALETSTSIHTLAARHQSKTPFDKCAQKCSNQPELNINKECIRICIKADTFSSQAPTMLSALIF